MRQLNENQIFQYNGSPITFQKGDSVMVNATEMAKPFGKRCNDFLSTKQTKELISSLSAKTGIPATGLVTVNQGGNNQGTWMHEDLALVFAQWLSPDFYLWCNDRIKELLQYGMTATQPTLEQMINKSRLGYQSSYTVKERTGGKATIGIGSAEEGTREADYHRGSKASRSIHGMCNKLVYQYSHRRSCETYHPKRI